MLLSGGSYMENNANIPEEYRPISMWGYFGYEILFSIPIIGFILLLIYSFSATNVSKRNFARSYFCFTIIVLLLIVIGIAIGLATGAINSLIGN